MTIGVARVCMLFLAALALAACHSEDDPTGIAYKPEVEILLNEGRRATNLTQISVRVSGADADSVLIWNEEEPKSAGSWFAFVDSLVFVPAWEIRLDEGEAVVNFVLSKNRVLSIEYQARVFVDLTAPHVAPTAIKPHDLQQECATGMQLAWSAAEDNFSPADSLVYRVYLDADPDPTAVLWQGKGRGCLVPGLWL